MKIIVDAFGGDNAPLEVLKGCEMARNKFGVDIVLSGNEKAIRACAKDNGIGLDNTEIINADSIIEMCDEPKAVIKGKSDSSMAVGMKALAEDKGDVFVSAGSTGAVVMGATFIVKRIKGLKRPALASMMPSYKNPIMIMDIGANVECHAENLVQFALMSDIYMKNVVGMKNPKISLANIGEEPTKGTDVLQETYKLLKKTDKINFCGNIEARDIPFGKSDVIICNGFTGNILLKMYEGVANAMIKSVKDIFMQNIVTKISAALVMGEFKNFKKKMDYTEFGGAPLMGVRKPVIKAHGSSDAKSFCNAIRQGIECAKSDVCGQIANLVKE